MKFLSKKSRWGVHSQNCFKNWTGLAGPKPGTCPILSLKTENSKPLEKIKNLLALNWLFTSVFWFVNTFCHLLDLGLTFYPFQVNSPNQLSKYFSQKKFFHVITLGNKSNHWIVDKGTNASIKVTKMSNIPATRTTLYYHKQLFKLCITLYKKIHQKND